MKEVRILCWNVNGIRAARRNGFLEWLEKESPDILCAQETKAHPEQLDEKLREPEGYHTYWNFPERKGYGGVATFSKEKPLHAQKNLGVPEFDIEGRVLISENPSFTLFNVYFPNGRKNKERLKYKLDFYDAFFGFIETLRKKGQKLIICGDFNTAHKEIDIARSKENEKISGYLPIERNWLDKLVAHGYVDTFRYINKEPNQYTWWDLKTRARERNVGWRIDYFFVTENLVKSISRAYILPNVMGSDHCPIGITLKPF
jgi:exodeoxyribonuclease-3